MLKPADILRRQGAEALYRVVVGNDPAANAEIDVTVPGGVIWLVLSMRVTLVADANVANRGVNLALDDGTNEYARLGSPGPQTAGTTFRHTWAKQYGAASNVTSSLANTSPFPDLPLLSGHHIRTATINFQAGDNYGAPVLYVMEYQRRGLAAELAYEASQIMQENQQLDRLESGGF